MVTTLERLRAALPMGGPRAPISELVGLRLQSAEPGRIVFSLDVRPEFANPMGTTHGGILATLADSAMGMAYASTLAEDESFTTLELKINFLRPVWSGRLLAEGTVTSAGRTVALTACDVTDEQGRIVAHATSTCMKLEGAKANGREVGRALLAG